MYKVQGRHFVTLNQMAPILMNERERERERERYYFEFLINFNPLKTRKRTYKIIFPTNSS